MIEQIQESQVKIADSIYSSSSEDGDSNKKTKTKKSRKKTKKTTKKNQTLLDLSECPFD